MHDLSDTKGLLFDKDGTLIDFSATWLQPMKDVAHLIATRAGQPDLAMRLLTDGGYLPETDSWAPDSAIAFETSERILKRWSALSSPALIETLLPQIQSIIFTSLGKAIPVIEDIAGLFSTMKAQYFVGVASMDDEVNVKQTLDGLGIHPQLDFYCGADSGHGHKPGPGMVHAFCEQVAIPPQNIVVIGDAIHDLKMARAAGATAVGVLSGASSRDTLSAHADLIINDIGELPELLKIKP